MSVDGHARLIVVVSVWVVVERGVGVVVPKVQGAAYLGSTDWPSRHCPTYQGRERALPFSPPRPDTPCL